MQQEESQTVSDTWWTEGSCYENVAQILKSEKIPKSTIGYKVDTPGVTLKITIFFKSNKCYAKTTFDQLFCVFAKNGLSTSETPGLVLIKFLITKRVVIFVFIV